MLSPSSFVLQFCISFCCQPAPTVRIQVSAYFTQLNSISSIFHITFSNLYFNINHRSYSLSQTNLSNSVGLHFMSCNALVASVGEPNIKFRYSCNLNLRIFSFNSVSNQYHLPFPLDSAIIPIIHISNTQIGTTIPNICTYNKR